MSNKHAVMFGLPLALFALFMVFFVIPYIVEEVHKQESSAVVEEFLNGIPTNVESAGGRMSHSLSVIVQTEDGRNILCSSAPYPVASWDVEKVTNGKTVIQSEIDDGDDESISLRGRFNGDVFEFSFVSAGGFTVEAKTANL